ncbi:unnamed protein product [Gongylonema pulchrum]|uniref:Uncharacterized protein n=1 Tax=Gongylonema pulchrum TaxID=637853 RepID=A0A183F027_9BILA|nr:unnamed protein product [Gongylonema pulchrum]
MSAKNLMAQQACCCIENPPLSGASTDGDSKSSEWIRHMETLRRAVHCLYKLCEEEQMLSRCQVRAAKLPFFTHCF